MVKGLVKVFILLTFLFLLTQEANSQCIASFSKDSNLCFKDSVQFSFTGTADSVLWDFGDSLSGFSNTDTNRIIKHRFTNSGNYVIRNIAISAGCRDTFIDTIFITPRVSLGFTIKNNCLGLNTAFLNTSIVNAQDSIVSYLWNFGDTNTSVLLSPNHQYDTLGIKNVLLISKTKLGCNDTLSKPINVFDSVSYHTDKDTACKNSNVSFSYMSNSSLATSYKWFFGNGISSNLSAPLYAYGQAGKFYYSLELGFLDSSICLLNTDSIAVLEEPKATYVFLTDTLQCFKRNLTCIKFAASSNVILTRNVIWDDGTTSVLANSDSIACHYYNNKDGGDFFITHEVADVFGCSNSYKDTVSVNILKEQRANFEFEKDGGCFITNARFANTSNMWPPLVETFLWDFGDGTFDSTNWSNLNKKYTVDGNFAPKLIITDTFGCQDTFISNQSILNINYPIDAKLDTAYGYCRLNSDFQFKQTPIANGSATWYFTATDSIISFNPRYSYSRGFIGDYVPRVRLSKLGCDSLIVIDTVTVYGPYARASILNQFQCQIKDTVYYNNVTAMFKNKSTTVNWRLIDPWATDCTIDTKAGLNINTNCNNSRDSLSFKHMFTPGREMCYAGFLVVKDTVVGCYDSALLTMPLMRPNADGLSVFYNNRPCVGPEFPKEVSVNLMQTTPGCGQQNFWVMWDSLCAEESGNFNGNWSLNQYRHNYSYNNLPCDSQGYVTMGLIIENGLDSFGNSCRDTGFYHHIIKFGLLDPKIGTNYKPDSLYCKNNTFKFFAADSIQDSITRVVWNFGDGTVLDTNVLGVINHTYTMAGNYLVRCYLEHGNGCSGFDTFRVLIGIIKIIEVVKDKICLGDTLHLNNQSFYWNDLKPFFKDTMRANLGLEQIRWNLSDGNGFAYTGSSVSHVLPKIGDYTVYMEVKDSLGCLDTATYFVPARVFDVRAQISLTKDTLVCPQVVQLFSSSSVYDSINSFGHTDDSVRFFVWRFSNGTGSSIQVNPFKFFDKGSQIVKLNVENTIGCRDSFQDTLFIVNPRADFLIVNDTSGCQPHQITFKNESQNANAYSWFFGNPGNNVFNTNNYNDVNFNYTNYGLFKPYLIARRSFVNNGIPISCTDTFPLSKNGQQAINVLVYEKPSVNFRHTTNCSNYTTTFTNTTILNTALVANVIWHFGDGDTSSLLSPVHQFVDTGRYLVRLIITSNNGCIDSIRRLIYISPVPDSDFSFNEACRGQATNFNDLTNAYNDVIFQWQWNFGNGVSSVQKNPNYIYPKDSTYRVALRVTNRAGCIDTVSKLVKVNATPTVDFTFTNACFQKLNYFYGNARAKNDTISYEYFFGDGNITLGKNLEHLYQDSGNYAAKLIVTSVFGCKDSISKNVRVYPKPKADFTVNDASQCLKNNNFVFTSTSSVNTDTLRYYYWLTSNGAGGNSPVFSRVFTNFDSLSARLIVSTNHLCSDTLIKPIYVLPSPKASPFISERKKCINAGDFLFADTGKNALPLASRKWFIDGLLHTQDSSFSWTFSTPGLKVIMLTKALINGCTDTFETIIEVYPRPQAKIGIIDSAQCFEQHRFLFADLSSISNAASLSRKWFFGNGDSGVFVNFAYKYAVSDTFLVTLYIISGQNCKDTAYQRVITHPNPLVDFSIDTNQQCLRANDFVFTNLSSLAGHSLSYNWNFANQGSSALENPSFSFSNLGLNSTSLVATSGVGCKDSLSRAVTIHPMPLSNIAINDSSQCVNNQNFIFTDNSTISSGRLKRTWMWNNGDSSSNPMETKFFIQDTSLVHSLISYSDFNCLDTTFFTTIIHPKPVASFAINDSGQCVNNQQFNFINLGFSKEGLFSTLWNFDDGNISVLTSPTHQYNIAGTYNVQQIVNSPFSCADTTYAPIIVYHKPIAALTVNDSAQCFVEQDFRFTGASSIPIGTIDLFLWDTLNTPFYGSKDTILIFPGPGQYNVEYVVESNFGCLDTTAQRIVVHPNPESNFTINDSIQCENNNDFEFNVTSTIAGGSFNSNWITQGSLFGSGSTANYEAFIQDTFQVRLVNISDKGCADSISKLIYIKPKPNISYSVNDSGQCLSINNFQFINATTIEEGIISFAWSFGDGAFSILENPNHRFANHGNYNIGLIAQSDAQCLDTLFMPILVHPEPRALLNVNDPSQCLSGNLFDLNSTSTIDSTVLFYTWFLGDGTTLNGQNISHSYSLFNDYTIKLRVNSTYNCLDSAMQSITVSPMPQVTLAVNDSTQCINEQQFIFTNFSTIAKGNLDNWRWTARNVNQNNINPFLINYAQSGWEKVSLTVFSDSGCVDSVSKKVRIYPKPLANIEVNDSLQCLRGNNFEYVSTSSDSFGIKNNFWIENNRQVFSGNNYIKQYLSWGNKLLYLISTSNNDCADTSQIEVRVKRMPNPNFNRLKSFYCNFEPTFNLIPDEAGGVFAGKNVMNQAYESNFLWEDTVTYAIEVEGCQDSSSQNTRVYPLPNADLGADTTLCKHETIILRPTSWNSSYLWQDKHVQDTFIAGKEGWYWVTVSNICGQDTDSLNIKIRTYDCKFYLPNAFTPNADRINQRFKPVTFDVTTLTYEIYNSWGGKIYQGDLSDDGWDGTFLGKPSPEGYYVIVAKYGFNTAIRAVTETAQGVFYLLR